MQNIHITTKFINNILRFLKVLFLIVGIVFSIILILSFTDLPFYGYYYLGTENTNIESPPDYIVILSGNGMPSPDGLIKTYYASIAAREYPKAKIIVAMPYNDGGDSLYEANLIANELSLRGVDLNRIIINPYGYNTHSQAESIAVNLKNEKENISLLIVTSPEHIYRSVHTFLKLGFKEVYGMPTFEKPIDENKLKDTKNKETPSLSFRYNIWSYMNYELIVFREYLAIMYYKLRGWI